MKNIFKIISIAIIISILTCNVYTFLYSENQVFLNLSDIEAFAGKEYSSIQSDLPSIYVSFSILSVKYLIRIFSILLKTPFLLLPFQVVMLYFFISEHQFFYCFFRRFIFKQYFIDLFNNRHIYMIFLC